MLRIIKNVQGTVSEGKLADVNPLRKVIWIDLLDPTKQELKAIAEATKLDIEDLKISLDEDERPHTLELDGYTLFVFAAPHTTNKKISTTSFGVILSENLVITVHKKAIKAVDKVASIPHLNLKSPMRTTQSLMFRLFDHVINDYFNLFDEIEDKIDKIEDIVFTNPDKATVKSIFNVKKTLIYFHKALTANREVITTIEKGYTSLKSSNKKSFGTLYNDITQLIEMEGTYRDILTGTLDIYLSSVSNNLNHVMKKMTAYASMLLVPTLISGIYGMNFRIMPELYWEHGYWFALSLMVLSVLILFFFFKRNKWI